MECAFFSPRRLLVSGAGTTVKLWEVASGKELLRLLGRTGDARDALAFFSGQSNSGTGNLRQDGGAVGYRRAAQAGRPWEDTRARPLGRILSGRQAARIRGYRGAAPAVGCRLAPGDRAVQRGDAVGLLPVFPGWHIPDHRGRTGAHQAVEPGNDVATAIPKGQTTVGSSQALSPDGRTLAVSVGSKITLWNLATRQAVIDLSGHSSSADQHMAFSPDGRTLASAGSDGTVRFWQASSFLEAIRCGWWPAGEHSGRCCCSGGRFPTGSVTTCTRPETRRARPACEAEFAACGRGPVPRPEREPDERPDANLRWRRSVYRGPIRLELGPRSCFRLRRSQCRRASWRPA